MSRRKIDQAKLQYWAGMIHDCQHSDLKTKEWLANHGISINAKMIYLSTDYCLMDKGKRPGNLIARTIIHKIQINDFVDLLDVKKECRYIKE